LLAETVDRERMSLAGRSGRGIARRAEGSTRFRSETCSTAYRHTMDACARQKAVFAAELLAMLPRLRAFALYLSRNHSDAEDLVQRACLRGLERAHQLRPDTSTVSWMFSILHSIWLNEVRANKVRSKTYVE
jgi:Sigma-70 region 2